MQSMYNTAICSVDRTTDPSNGRKYYHMESPGVTETEKRPQVVGVVERRGRNMRWDPVDNSRCNLDMSHNRSHNRHYLVLKRMAAKFRLQLAGLYAYIGAMTNINAKGARG